MSNEVELAKRTVYNADVRSKLGDSIKLPSKRLPKFVQQDWDAEPYDDYEVEKPLEPFEADLLASETVLCPISWGINLSHIYAREVR